KVEPELVERTEHRVRLLQRLIDAMGGPISWSPPPEGYYAASVNLLSRPTDEALRALIRATIVEVADRGNAGIVAHAASFALSERTNVLRVLVTASFATRLERLAATRLMDPKEAEVILRDSDKERQAYLRRFYNVAEELPTHYDVVVNSDRLAVEQAVR